MNTKKKKSKAKSDALKFTKKKAEQVKLKINATPDEVVRVLFSKK